MNNWSSLNRKDFQSYFWLLLGLSSWYLPPSSLMQKKGSSLRITCFTFSFSLCMWSFWFHSILRSIQISRGVNYTWILASILCRPFTRSIYLESKHTKTSSPSSLRSLSQLMVLFSKMMSLKTTTMARPSQSTFTMRAGDSRSFQ